MRARGAPLHEPGPPSRLVAERRVSNDRGRLDATRNHPAATSLLGLSGGAEALWSFYGKHSDVVVARWHVEYNLSHYGSLR